MTDTATLPLEMRLLEEDRIPDWLIRRRIRALLAQRLREEDKGDPEVQQAHLMESSRQGTGPFPSRGRWMRSATPPP